MKALVYISILAALLASSCATGGLSSVEYDDLYYSSSDKAVRYVSKAAPVYQADDNSAMYYDNIYASDTLIAEEYNGIVDYDGAGSYGSDRAGAFEYLDDPWSYSNRLSMFYGNSFYPYWRDPFYYNPWYSSYDYYPYSSYYGMGGYPWYSPYGNYYGGYYGGYYGSLYGGMGYRYSPFSFYMGSGFYYPYYPMMRYNSSKDYSGVDVGRRDRYSSLSSNSNLIPPRKSAVSVAGESAGRRTAATSQTAIATDSRRSGSAIQNNTSGNRAAAQTYGARREGSALNNPGSRPAYNSANRAYTPSYSNPRMSERPAYNNSRSSSGNTQQGIYNSTRSSGTQGVNRSVSTYSGNRERTPSSFSTNQFKSGSVSSGSSGNYTVPSRRTFDSGSSSFSGSSRSYNSDYSGSSVRSGSSSYSSGSSSSGSSSYSSGGGSSAGRSSGVSSGGRR